MWIYTDTGFVSLVVNKNDHNLLQVRSRLAEDITSIFPDAKVFIINGADYRYRADVRRAEVAVIMAEKVMNMDYTSHFKDVALQRSKPAEGRSTAYYAVWGAMGKLQDYAPYSKVSRADAAKIAQKYPASTGKGTQIWETRGTPVFQTNDFGWTSGGNSFTDTGTSLRDEADDFWVKHDQAELDRDMPEIDPEVEDAIATLEDKYGLHVLDAMSADEWEDLLVQTITEQRELQKAKDAQPVHTGNGGNRKRNRKRGNRRKR